MAKPRIPNQKQEYSKLNRRLAQYVASVQRLYAGFNAEAARIAVSTGHDGETPFSWKKYPQTSERVRKLQEWFMRDLGALVMAGTTDEWKRSNVLQDMIADKVMRAYHVDREGGTYDKYYRDNSDALRAFQSRREGGMNISDKLWEQSKVYKNELEDAIGAAIERGTDAITLSKQISKYLIDFPSLQKDYKKKFGKACKSHDCEYRSIRLARSEINMAYRTSEQSRWQQFDFVIGYEIKTSGSHPASDVCDRLKGKYPKDFVWTGWHPNCMCYAVPILKTEEEFFEGDGKKSENEVTDVPQGFKDWCTENWNRISEAKKRGTLPYFLQDNNEYARKELNVIRAAELRHKNRDEEQVRMRWKQRSQAIENGDYEDYLRCLSISRYYGVSTEELQSKFASCAYVDSSGKYIKTGTYTSKFYEDIEEFEKKYIYPAHNKYTKPREELNSMLAEIRRDSISRHDYSDIVAEIEAFRNSYNIPGGVIVGRDEVAPDLSAANKFVKEMKFKLKKRIDKFINDEKKYELDTGLSIKMPDVFMPGGDYLRGEDYKFSPDFFNKFDEAKSKWVVNSTLTEEEKALKLSSYYDPAKKCARIYDGERNEKSKYERKCVIYHEGGHMLDDQLGIKKQSWFADLIKKYEDELEIIDEYNVNISGKTQKVKITRGSFIDIRLNEVLNDIFSAKNGVEPKEQIVIDLLADGYSLDDIKEMTGSTADTLLGLSRCSYGWGHDRDYMIKDGGCESEVLAHIFEISYLDNPIMKKFLNEFYRDAIAQLKKNV